MRRCGSVGWWCSTIARMNVCAWLCMCVVGERLRGVELFLVAGWGGVLFYVRELVFLYFCECVCCM